MESEERVRAMVQEVVRAHRLSFRQGGPPLSPFICHVSWFLVQATLLQRPQLSGAGANVMSFKEVVERCSNLLALKDCPAVETIQLQVRVHAHIFMQQMNLAAEERGFMKNLDNVVRSILSIQKARSKHEPSNMSNASIEKVVIIDGKDVSNMKCLRVQLNGFCLMSIIRHGGYLVNGDPKAGLVQVGEKSYTFSTYSYMNEFAQSPKEFLTALEMMVIMMPQLINTLGLQREPKFAHLAIPNILELVNKQPLELEFATQTATHIQAEHQFDEDTLFLRATELASKQTHSTQTDSSHFHRDAGSQVWLPSNKSTQSLFGKGTTMPKMLKLYENLRGPPHFKFNPVDILLDV